MFYACRPMGRLFYCLLLFITASPAWLSAQTPSLTTVSDVVYRADGTTASGTLLISWPQFSTSGGQAVAAGTKSVILGTGGALSVALVPNAGATPAGTFYTVVYQLGDTVKTEFWTIPTISPTTISAIRTTPGSTPTLVQLATQQYVNTAVAGKANDSAVVHLAGNENITGVKQFSAAPTLPTPVHTTDAANKAYVDSSVANVGSGAYVPLAGGTMSGPLTLPSDPVSTNQATTRHYVDAGLANKADVSSGKVPTSELGSGTANNTLCLHGDLCKRIHLFRQAPDRGA